MPYEPNGPHLISTPKQQPPEMQIWLVPWTDWGSSGRVHDGEERSKHGEMALGLLTAIVMLSQMIGTRSR